MLVRPPVIRLHLWHHVLQVTVHGSPIGVIFCEGHGSTMIFWRLIRRKLQLLALLGLEWRASRATAQILLVCRAG